MANYVLVGTKIFPHKFEKDRVIDEFLKKKMAEGENKSDIVRKALYAYAIQEQQQQPVGNHDEVLQNILNRLEKLEQNMQNQHHNQSQFAESNIQSSFIASAAQSQQSPPAPALAPAATIANNPTLNLPPLEQLAVESSDVEQTNSKNLRRNMLKSFQKFSIN